MNNSIYAFPVRIHAVDISWVCFCIIFASKNMLTVKICWNQLPSGVFIHLLSSIDQLAMQVFTDIWIPFVPSKAIINYETYQRTRNLIAIIIVHFKAVVFMTKFLFLPYTENLLTKRD